MAEWTKLRYAFAQSQSCLLSPCDAHTLSGEQRHTAADPVVLEPLGRLFVAVGPSIGTEFSADWLAQAVSRIDGSPVLDPRSVASSRCQRSIRRKATVSGWSFESFTGPTLKPLRDWLFGYPDDRARWGRRQARHFTLRSHIRSSLRRRRAAKVGV
jgi:hypothetical protein